MKNNKDDFDPRDFDDNEDDEDQEAEFWRDLGETKKDNDFEPSQEEMFEDLHALFDCLFENSGFTSTEDAKHTELLNLGYHFLSNSDNTDRSIAETIKWLNENHGKRPFCDFAICPNAYDFRGHQLHRHVSIWGKTLDA